MNNYEEWAQLVAHKLRAEADIIAAIDKDELEDDAARQAFARTVLEPFLPLNYAIGCGRVVDALGNYSEHLDIVIYNRDYPGIGLRGTHPVYLLESVLACIVVKAKLLRKTFFGALDSGASVAALNTNIPKAMMLNLATRNGLVPDSRNNYVHPDPLRTSRFKMIGRPPVFIYAFSGIKNSHRQLKENIELWIDNRRKRGSPFEMPHLPSVIATQGCFAWRNAAPLALRNREMMGIGVDTAPIRLIVLQLLHIISRRLSTRADSNGLKPNLRPYLHQFSPPKISTGAGSIDVQTSTPTTAAQPAAKVVPEAKPTTGNETTASAQKEPPGAESSPTIEAQPGQTADDQERKSSRQSTDVFIGEVKQQMPASEPLPQFQPENKPEPFTSTIPQ